MCVIAAALIVFAGSVFAAGTGTVDRVSGWYAAGTNLTATATAGADSSFTGWQGNTNGCTINSNQLSFTVTGPRSITAQFTSTLMSIVTVVSPVKGSITPGGTIQVPDGGTTNFVITPDNHYLVSALYTNGTAVTVADPAGFSYIWSNVKGSNTLQAVFSRKKTATGSVPTEWLAAAVPRSTNDYEAAVTNDADGDGFTTAEEYWAGTDPTNSASLLSISQIQMSGTNGLLVWSHARVDAGIPPISIQRRASLVTGSWTNVATYTPTNGINTWASPLPSNGFFRLCVTNMP